MPDHQTGNNPDFGQLRLIDYLVLIYCVLRILGKRQIHDLDAVEILILLSMGAARVSHYILLFSHQVIHLFRVWSTIPSGPEVRNVTHPCTSMLLIILEPANYSTLLAFAGSPALVANMSPRF